jgi:hypothetical protein
MRRPKGSRTWRVAHWIPSIFLLDEAAQGEDITFVIHRGVIRRGCTPGKRQSQNRLGALRGGHPPLNLRSTSSAPRLNRYHHKVPTTKIHAVASALYFHANANATREIGRSTSIMPTHTIPRYCKLGMRCPSMLMKQAQRWRTGKR